jgi:hypothetical protein
MYQMKDSNTIKKKRVTITNDSNTITGDSSPLSVVYTTQSPIFKQPLFSFSAVQIKVLLYLGRCRNSIQAYLFGKANNINGVHCYQDCRTLADRGYLVRTDGTFSLSPLGRQIVESFINDFKAFLAETEN